MADQRGEGSQRFRITPKLVLVVVILVLVLVFVFQNTGKRKTNLLVWHVNGPAWAGLFACLAIGFVIGSAFPWFRRRGREG